MTQRRNSENSPRLGYRPRELARAFGLSARHVYNLIGSGQLRAYRAGGKAIVVRDEDWQRFLERGRLGHREAR